MCEKEYEQKIKLLEEKIAYLTEENERLSSENQLLHDTAWSLIHKLRIIEGKDKKTKKD